MSKKQRYLVGVGAVVLLGAVVFAFTLSPKAPSDTPTATSTEQVATTTDIFAMEPIVPEAKVSTEGWKTCRNEEYGYEFKFPAEWHIYGDDALGEPIGGKRSFVRESEECNGASVLLSSVEPWSGIVATEEDGGIHIEVHSKKQSDDDYWRDYSTTMGERGQSFFILLDGNIGVLGISGWLRHDGSRSWGARTIHQQQIYHLHGDFYDQRSPTIHAILSTLHLSNSATTTQE